MTNIQACNSSHKVGGIRFRRVRKACLFSPKNAELELQVPHVMCQFSECNYIIKNKSINIHEFFTLQVASKCEH